MNKNYIAEPKEILAAGSMTQAQLAERLGVTFAAINLPMDNGSVYGYTKCSYN